MNSKTGNITVAKQERLDYEVQKAFQLTVVATDNGGRRGEMALTVNLQDVNDNAPKFSLPEYQAYNKEGQTSFTSAVTVEVCKVVSNYSS